MKLNVATQLWILNSPGADKIYTERNKEGSSAFAKLPNVKLGYNVSVIVSH
ncbi:MAG: hypothetical protein KBF99_08610 [Leptospiraceae bacterium]|nr:hypothetical protein [Leptospiraceae bacterium]MBK9502097.1 hypothetical protein [Leptospiraceae bacterium]MBL0266839.1 hypothetical protein [Leptospiraceae bacterium]MBP9163232.1 hypothetical protein [Leptospiraceae bacterium]